MSRSYRLDTDCITRIEIPQFEFSDRGVTIPPQAIEIATIRFIYVETVNGLCQYNKQDAPTGIGSVRITGIAKALVPIGRSWQHEMTA
jgi:hypothetical protein